MFKIQGGQDKQGFAMKQGVLTNNRVRLLMSRGDQGFRGFGRRTGETGASRRQCSMAAGSGQQGRCSGCLQQAS